MAPKPLMFAPELLTTGALLTAALGAAGGAALTLGIYLFRDRHVLLHRWRKRQRIASGDYEALTWDDEPDGYLPDAVSEEEREQLPLDLAMSAVLGAIWLVGAWYQSDGLIFVLVAGALIWSTVTLLRDDNSPVLDAEVGEESQPMDPARRWRLIAANLLFIGFVAVTTLRPLKAAFGRWFDAAPNLFYAGGAVLAGLALWALATGIDPDSDLPNWRSYDFPREAVFGLIGALVMVGAIVGFATVM
uniref:hypothetical protein n=1 Tax=Parerythrobacter lutipelagi TaxID=1964208 RepID=UPI0019587686|nr:hypothetical protein [Parerythrobacter lutipelagi]